MRTQYTIYNIINRYHIVNLLSRFYEPTSGKILIDGKDYKDRSVAWLHSHLGYVLQTPHLFSGTIMENIRSVAAGVFLSWAF